MLHQSAAVMGPRFQALRLAGAEATAWIDGSWDLWIGGRAGDPERVAIPDDLAPRAVTIPEHAGPFAARELPSFVRAAEAFADALAGNPPCPGSPRPATFEDGLACQRLMDAARTASRSHTWIEVGA